MLPRKSMSSFCSYNFFICMVEMNEGFICIYQHSICFITYAILKASAFAILHTHTSHCTCVWCTKVWSEAGITTSHISLSEVSLEFWNSSKMAVRLGVRPGVCCALVCSNKRSIASFSRAVINVVNYSTIPYRNFDFPKIVHIDHCPSKYFTFSHQIQVCCALVCSKKNP